VAPVVSSLPTNIAARTLPINLDRRRPPEHDLFRSRHSGGADQTGGIDRGISVVNDEWLPGGRLPQ
jgi:hypothetical protein